MSFYHLPEKLSASLISHELAMQAVRAAYIAAAQADSATFPVVLGHGAEASHRFSIKSACQGELVGLKLGTYWPKNDAAGLPRHSSSVILIDHDVGRIGAVVEATTANGYRTAAGNALAVGALARRDASRLAIFGAGHQAHFEIGAIIRVREIKELYIVNRDRDKADRLAEEFRAGGMSVRISSADDACANADIIVTVTGSRAPLLRAEAVLAGTHISCMGADGPGKRELPAELLHSARLFCDYLPQSQAIGELQHVAGAIREGSLSAINIGDVLAGNRPGRIDDTDITVFDSSGLALQDLFLAQYLLEEARRRGVLRPISDGQR